MSPLEAFLRQHRVLTKFKKNYKKYPISAYVRHKEYTFRELCGMPFIDSAISEAFSWTKTEEGWGYWRKLHLTAGGKYLFQREAVIYDLV